MQSKKERGIDEKQRENNQTTGENERINLIELNKIP
jgi:hypothetical protein